MARELGCRRGPCGSPGGCEEAGVALPHAVNVTLDRAAAASGTFTAPHAVNVTLDPAAAASGTFTAPRGNRPAPGQGRRPARKP